MADGNHIEVAKAYVTIVPSMEGSQKTIATEMGAVVEPAAKETGEKSGKSLGESLAKGLKTTAAVIGAAMTAATAAAAATGKAFVSAAKDTAEYGDSIQKNAQKMNMSISGYQEWDYILKRNGASIDGMKTSMLKLTKAAESGDKAFADLGITEEELKNMSPEQTFNRTIQALQNVTDEGQRTVLANKLLGKGATELAPLLNSTAEETEALRKQVHDLGGVMSDEAVNDSVTFQDSLTDMETALNGVKRNMMAQFLPGMSQVMTGLSKVFSGNGGVEEIRNGLKDLVGKISGMAPTFFSIASELINGIISGFAPMIPQLVSSIFGFLQTGLLTLVQLIPQLTPVITQGLQGVASALLTCLPVLIQALIDMASQLVQWLASDDNVKTFVDGIMQIVSVIASGLADALPILIPAIINICGQLVDSLTDPKNIKSFVQAALTIVGAVVVALVKALPEIGGVIVKLATNVLGLLKDLGSSILAKIGPWFTQTMGKIGQFFMDIVNKFKELPGKLLDIGKNLITSLWKGISDKIQWVKDKIAGMGQAITKAIKSVFGIHSPSKVWRREIGQNLGLSIGLGFDDVIGGVTEDMTDSMSGLTASMNVTATGAGQPALGGSTTNYNGGAVTINVYGAEGQNVNDLAEVIAQKLEAMTARKKAVYV